MFLTFDNERLALTIHRVFDHDATVPLAHAGVDALLWLRQPGDQTTDVVNLRRDDATLHVRVTYQSDPPVEAGAASFPWGDPVAPGAFFDEDWFPDWRPALLLAEFLTVVATGRRVKRWQSADPDADLRDAVRSMTPLLEDPS